MSASIFGDAVYTYTRAQAIEDGVLVDISETARESGIKFPVAITDTLFNLINPSKEAAKRGQSLAGRLWDVLHMLKTAIRSAAGNPSSLHFSVKIGGENHVLKSICGPSDDGSPCITIMLPHED